MFGPKRYVWLCQHPDGKARIYVKLDSLEDDLPLKFKQTKKALDDKGEKWEYGKVDGKKFRAVKMLIRDSEKITV